MFNFYVWKCRANSVRLSRRLRVGLSTAETCILNEFSRLNLLRWACCHNLFNNIVARLLNSRLYQPILDYFHLESRYNSCDFQAGIKRELHFYMKDIIYTHVIKFLGQKYGVKKWGTILLRYLIHSDGAARPTSNMKIKVTLYIIHFHSTLNPFLRCAWASFHLYLPPLFLFLDLKLWDISELVIIIPNLYFCRFCECRPKVHIILPPGSEYFSSVVT